MAGGDFPAHILNTLRLQRNSLRLIGFHSQHLHIYPIDFLMEYRLCHCAHDKTVEADYNAAMGRIEQRQELVVPTAKNPAPGRTS
jgi:hypothetical protein